MTDGQASTNKPTFTHARLILRAAAVGLAAIVGGWLMRPTAPPPVQAAPPYALIKTYPNPTPAADEEFGNAVAWLGSGDRAVIGARSDELSGAVYIVDRDTGATLQVLQKPVPAPGDYFGWSMAVSGTSVLVGVPHDDTASSNSGAAYLFDGDTGAVVMSYTNPITGSDQFGSAVAILTDTVLIGAPQYNAPALADTGRAYICLVGDGTCLTIIENQTPGDGDNFGYAVATLGDRFAVSAPLDNRGVVYVFTTTTHLLAQTIVPTSTSTGDNFGRSLAAVGGNLLIGAPNDDTGADDAGAAYLYSPDGVLLRSFFNPDPDINDHFGGSVAGDAELLLIGAPDDNTGGSDRGSAYLFDANTGALIDTFHRSPAKDGAQFGISVAIRGEDFLIGALDSIGNMGPGEAYHFGVSTLKYIYLPIVARP